MGTIAIIGLGNIGTIFAAHLISAARHRVIACVRSPVETLKVEGAYGAIQAHPDTFTQPSAVPLADWVLLCTKTQDTTSAAPWLERLCGPETRVAILQNGIDRERFVAPYCGASALLPTVVLANGKKIGPHSIRHLTPSVDLLVPETQLGESLVRIFEGSFLQVKTSADFTAELWRKFLANIVANPLTALTGRGIEVVRGGEMEQLALGLLQEAAAAGRAFGVPMPDDVAGRTLKWMSQYPGDTGTSMLQDRLDGRPLEFEALNGTVVRLGEEHGIPTPLNRVICALLSSINN